VSGSGAPVEVFVVAGLLASPLLATVAVDVVALGRVGVRFPGFATAVFASASDPEL
jgi:type IV secretory pathway TrbD component